MYVDKKAFQNAQQFYMLADVLHAIKDTANYKLIFYFQNQRSIFE